MHLGFPVVPLEYNIANSVSKSNLLKSIFLALVSGVAISFVRRKVSRWKAEKSNQPAMY